MARPWKHPKSVVFWGRQRVPDDLLKLVGRREQKRSLQTRDPGEAKRRLIGGGCVTQRTTPNPGAIIPVIAWRRSLGRSSSLAA
jgi:hypothetical protein